MTGDESVASIITDGLGVISRWFYVAAAARIRMQEAALIGAPGD